MIVGYRCAVCETTVPVEAVHPWVCPNATPDDRYHVLHLVDDLRPPEVIEDPNPFVRYAPRMAWWAFAEVHAMPAAARIELARFAAGDFEATPFGRSDAIRHALGVDVWVKDETGNVAGSHKARHLAGILLHLLAAERLGLAGERRRLAIASCGNAAIAAATLAAGVAWPLDVFVPTWASASVVATLDMLGAEVVRCERRADDLPGDPAMLRFREAVRAGAIPFSVQGPENALCLDGGRTIGWEIADLLTLHARSDHRQVADTDGTWRAVAQVGGGALAACLGAGLGREVQLDTVQTHGCAPLAATWERIAGIDHPERSWSQVMRPWPDPHSVADGILDDETYDWIADVRAMVDSGGHPIVATEDQIVGAHRIARAAGFDVSATGSAGLAGVLAELDRPSTADHVIVVMSGVAR